MNFLLDENFPKSVRASLEEDGHRVIDFRRVGVRGSDDDVVLQLATLERAIVLTTDRDFFHTLGRTPGHPGLVVIALKQPTREKILARLTWLIGRVGEDRLRGRAVQLRDQAWQAYPPFEEGEATAG